MIAWIFLIYINIFLIFCICLLCLIREHHGDVRFFKPVLKPVLIHTHQTFFPLIQKETGSTVQEVADKMRQITVVQVITVSLNYTYKQVLSIRTPDHCINL